MKNIIITFNYNLSFHFRSSTVDYNEFLRDIPSSLKIEVLIKKKEEQNNKMKF